MGPIVVVAAYFGINSGLAYRKSRRLKAARPGQTLEGFVEHFSREGVSEHVSTEAYGYLQALAGVRRFPVLSADSLRDVYWIGTWGGVPLWEVVDDLRVLCDSRRVGLRGVGEADPILTVEQEVRYLDRICPETAP